jgi:hypothetical protein
VIVSHVVVHGSKFKNFDQPIVEAVALLPKENGARTIQLDQSSDSQQ